MDVRIVYPGWVEVGLEEFRDWVLESLQAFLEAGSARELAERLARDGDDGTAIGVNGVCYDYSCVDEYQYREPMFVYLPREGYGFDVEVPCEVRAVVREWRNGSAELEYLEARCTLPKRSDNGFERAEENWEIWFTFRPEEVFAEEKKA